MGNPYGFLSDAAFWGYVVNSLLNSYLFFLFLWWAVFTRIKGGSISIIWVYLLLLFGGAGVQSITSAVARLYRSSDLDDYYLFLSGGFWMYRMYFCSIILIIIAVHMSYRAFFIRRRIVSDNGFHRRRKSDKEA